LVEIRTESRRLGARSPNWKQRGSRPAATGWDYQEAMVGSARRGGLIRRGPGGDGRGARRALGRGRNGGERKCAHASLASGSGRCMGYLTGQCVVQSPSPPPSLQSLTPSLLLETQRSPPASRDAPRGHPFIRHGAVSEPGVLSLLDRLVRKALLDSNGSGRPRAHHGATVTHGGARLDDRRALWIRSPVV
jgi:hypothetical protein